MGATQVEIGTGEPIESENLVEFRLLYSGQLLGASGKTTRADVKHALRREFHPQLRRLWESNHSLDQLARNRQLKTWMPKHLDVDLATLTAEERRKAGIEDQCCPKKVRALDRNCLTERG